MKVRERVKFGVSIFATDESMDFVALGRAAEERGFESIWVPEHVHIPVERTTPYPLSADGVLPDEYTRTYDPFVALAAVAGATARIRLGTGVCLVTEHEPIALAKAVASLDRLSGGRFLFGIGAGWLREEMEPLGTVFAARWQVTRQRIDAMTRLWAGDAAEYHSEFVDVPRTLVRPKPIQQPRPPVLIGAASRHARRRVVEWADGWVPNIPDPDFLERGMADIRRRAESAGRDPAAIRTTAYSADPEALDAYERLGVERCVFRLPHAHASVVLPELDRLAGLVAGR